MLDIKVGREGPPPLDASTILCLRDGPSGMEILCVERARASRFLGGAIVFPGGKLDASDGGELRVAACRECFEEAGLLFARGAAPSEADRQAMRAELANRRTFADVLASRGVALDLDRLVPFARWITPITEARRFDTRFFVARAPSDHEAVHDAHETTSAFWSTPAAVLERFRKNECALFPPTHRSLEVLAGARSVDEALAIAARASQESICPELVKQADGTGGETLALVLPGDPEHSVAEARVPGLSRYVLRGEQWLPEDAPEAAQRPSR